MILFPVNVTLSAADLPPQISTQDKYMDKYT